MEIELDVWGKGYEALLNELKALKAGSVEKE
jgi:hypothetical protein